MIDFKKHLHFMQNISFLVLIMFVLGIFCLLLLLLAYLRHRFNVSLSDRSSSVVSQPFFFHKKSEL